MQKFGIILSISLASIITIIIPTKLAHGTTDTSTHQPAIQANTVVNPQSSIPSNLSKALTTSQEPVLPSSSLQTPAANPAVATSTTDNNQIIPNHTPNVGILSGHIYYDANGNACGIGPTGICLLPVAKSFEVRDEANNLVQVVYSDSSGAFKTVLAPGKYTIIPEAGDGVNPSANQQTVTVSKTNYATITIVYSAIAVTNSPILN